MTRVLDDPQAGGVDCKDIVNYKKVAVVENFFDIIYDVHVEMDGRGGKHAGQKRTYKAVSIITYLLFSQLHFQNITKGCRSDN